MAASSLGEATDRAIALARSGAVAEAYRLLDEAVAGGDGIAAATLADWRMAGDLVRRDIGAAQALYGRALELGVEAAAGPYLALRASGAGGTPPPGGRHGCSTRWTSPRPAIRSGLRRSTRFARSRGSRPFPVSSPRTNVAT